LTDPIFSCFEILCVVKEVDDPITDEMLAEFVVNSHFKSQAKGVNIDDRSYSESQEDQASARPVDPEVLSQDLMKYITCAKLNIFPRFHDSDIKKLTQVYVEQSRESSHDSDMENAPFNQVTITLNAPFQFFLSVLCVIRGYTCCYFFNSLISGICQRRSSLVWM
jgi:DNA replication licensing factor MCM2